MVRKDGFDFYKSTRSEKKYDVYKNGEYVTSFGQRGAEHYFDKIGLYPELNHLDKKRKASYRARHAKDHITDKTAAGYFAWKYLW